MHSFFISASLLSCNLYTALPYLVYCTEKRKKKKTLLESEIYLRGVCRRVDLVLLAFDIIQSTLSKWDARVKEGFFSLIF